MITASSSSKLKLGIHECSTIEISVKEYVDRMKEVQNDTHYITDESIAVVSSLVSLEKLRKKDFEVLHMVDPVDEYVDRSSHNEG